MAPPAGSSITPLSSENADFPSGNAVFRSENASVSARETLFFPLKSTNFSHFPYENSGTDVQEWA